MDAQKHLKEIRNSLNLPYPKSSAGDSADGFGDPARHTPTGPPVDNSVAREFDAYAVDERMAIKTIDGFISEEQAQDDVERGLCRHVLASKTQAQYKQRAAMLGRMCTTKGPIWEGRIRRIYKEERENMRNLNVTNRRDNTSR